MSTPTHDHDSPLPHADEDLRRAALKPDTPQTRSPSYRLAFADPDFLLRDELRPVRFQLELWKPELLLAEWRGPCARGVREQLLAADVGAPIHLPKLDETFELAVAAARPRRRRVVQRVDDEQITDDWHNDYARLLLGLGRTLEALPDDAARRDLLRRMRHLLPP